MMSNRKSCLRGHSASVHGERTPADTYRPNSSLDVNNTLEVIDLDGIPTPSTTQNSPNKVRCKTAPAKSVTLSDPLSNKHNRSTGNSSVARSTVSSARKTVTRSARKSRTANNVTSSSIRDVSSDRLTDVTSEAGDSMTTGTRAPSDVIDFSGTDIYTETGWDTDLGEDEEELPNYHRSAQAIYLESCKQAKVIPASYFVRHMFDSTLDMKHHGLGPEGIKPFAVAMVSNTHVTRLDLTDNWLGRDGGHHVIEMLKENCFITDCDLSENRLDYTFAEKFIEVATNNSTLTHITLSGNDFDDRAAVYLAEALMTTYKLEYVNLSNNRLSERAGGILGPAIAENGSIKELDLSWNVLRRKGAVAIAQGIKNNACLLKVNLSWNGFGSDGAKAIGDALKVNTTLEEIDLSNNRITTEGAVLLGKGLSANECLKRLKMGKNPMQSAGCYAICAAITRNPNCVMEELDFTDVMVNSDFKDIYDKVKEKLPELRLKHGGDGLPKRPKARVHPMVKLQNYIAKHNIKLLDFFNKFDADGSMSVSREEFTEGIQESGIKLTDDEIVALLDELDKDGDGEINYSEMVMGHQDFTEKERKMAVTIMQYKR